MTTMRPRRMSRDTYPRASSIATSAHSHLSNEAYSRVQLWAQNQSLLSSAIQHQHNSQSDQHNKRSAQLRHIEPRFSGGSSRASARNSRSTTSSHQYLTSSSTARSSARKAWRMSFFPASGSTVRCRRSNGNMEFVRRHNSHRNSHHDAYYEDRRIVDHAEYDDPPCRRRPQSAILERNYFARRPEEREHYHPREAPRGRSEDRSVHEPAFINPPHQQSSTTTTTRHADSIPRCRPPYAPSAAVSGPQDQCMFQPLNPNTAWSRPGIFEDEYMSGALHPVEDGYFHQPTSSTSPHPQSNSRTSSANSRSAFSRVDEPNTSRPNSCANEKIDYRAIQDAQDRLVAFAIHESQQEARNRGYTDVAGEDEDINRAVRDSIASFDEEQTRRARRLSRSQLQQREGYSDASRSRAQSRPPTPSPYAESVDDAERDRPATLLPDIELRPMPSLRSGSASHLHPPPQNSRHRAPSRASRPEPMYPNSSTVSSNITAISRSSSAHRRVQWADQASHEADDEAPRRLTTPCTAPSRTFSRGLTSAHLIVSTGQWFADTQDRADRLLSVRADLERRLRRLYPQATSFVLRRGEVRSAPYDAELLVLRDRHHVRGIEVRSVYDDVHAMGKVMRILEDSM